MKREAIGVDLGTRNTVIYSSSRREVIYSEPTSVALDRKTLQIKEIGFLADEISGKTPYSYKVSYPVRTGLIQDIDLCTEIIARGTQKIDLGRRNFSIVFTCPSRTSKVNRMALFEIGKRLMARDVYIESEAKISALGVGDSSFAPTATLVVDIGAGYTDIAMISMGDIVIADSVPIGGDDFDSEIRRYLRTKQHMIIGSKTAEYAKLRIGTIADDGKNALVEINGKDNLTGLPSSVLISSTELRKIFVPLVERIALKVSDLLSLVDAELVSDLLRNGLLLTGGGSSLLGLREYLEDFLSMPVKIASAPMEATASGFMVYIDRMLERKD